MYYTLKTPNSLNDRNNNNECVVGNEFSQRTQKLHLNLNFSSERLIKTVKTLYGISPTHSKII